MHATHLSPSPPPRSDTTQPPAESHFILSRLCPSELTGGHSQGTLGLGAPCTPCVPCTPAMNSFLSQRSYGDSSHCHPSLSSPWVLCHFLWPCTENKEPQVSWYDPTLPVISVLSAQSSVLSALSAQVGQWQVKAQPEQLSNCYRTK